MRQCWYAAGLLILGSLSVGAEDPDPIKAKLEKAKQTYADQLKAVRQDVLKYLDSREGIARREGKSDLVAEIKAERQALEDDNEMPTLPKALEDRVSAASEALTKAYTLAIKAYIKDKKDSEAKEIEDALTAFRGELWMHLNIEDVTIKDGYLRLKRETLVTTKKEYTGPIEIVVVARTELENIRLHAYKGSCVIFNWEVKPDELRVTRPDGSDKRESGSLMTAKMIPLKPNVWYRIKWRITTKGMFIYVNDFLVFAEKRAYDLTAKGTFAVSSGTSPIEVKRFRVVPLPGTKD
jgi:hypothetical protein